jgi:hypothetical protein
MEGVVFKHDLHALPDRREPDCSQCKCESQPAASNSNSTFTETAITVQGSTAAGEVLPAAEGALGSKTKQVRLSRAESHR